MDHFNAYLLEFTIAHVDSHPQVHLQRCARILLNIDRTKYRIH
jgi:hypothetical protein